MAGSSPPALEHGELAVNYVDGNLFWRDGANSIRSFSLTAGAPPNPAFTGNATFLASAGVPVTITNTGTGLSFRVNDESGDASPFVIDDRGWVGIGTDAPLRSLTIAGGGFAFAEAGGSGRAIHWGDSTTGVMPVLVVGHATSSDQYLAFHTNVHGSAGVERMKIDAAGTVDVKSNAGNISHKLTYNEDGGEILLFDNVQAAATLLDQSVNQTRLLELVNGSNLVMGLGSGNTTGAIIFVRAGYTEAARIDSSGNLGIGTQTVSAGFRLDVRGAALFYRTTADGLVTVQGLQTQSGGTGKSALQIDVNGQGGFAWQCDATGAKVLRLISNNGYGAGESTLLTVTAAGVLAVGGNTVLHAGNYTSYSPTLTGSGASGTWAINVTGTAGSISGFGNPTAAATANTIAYRDGSGDSTFRYVFSQFVNMSHAASDRTADTVFYSSSDNYIRKTTAVGMRAALNVPTRTGGDASGTWAINVTGTANYQTGTGTANNFNTNFSETPTHGRAFREMSAGGPQGSWWFVENMRHTNGSNQWGRQNAWGWEDNANELWSRNVQAGNWGSWVRFIHSGNYNSYAPTLTGGGASGTWGISVTGTAASETLATVCSRGANASGSAITVNSVYAGNWFRSTGNSGWYSETHGGGIWMTDSTYVRVYNNKIFYADNIIQSGTSMYAPIFYDSQNPAYYCDPNGTSRMAAMDIDSLQVYGNHLYVGKADTASYSYIHMRDSDEGERLIHCNGNRIGFLSQVGNWSAWSYDNGTWGCYGGTEIAVEAIGGWGRYGTVIEARTDSNGAGTQDGPKIFYHKGGAKWWAAGIQPYAANGFAIWEDGSSVGWGTERLVIEPGGQITHNSRPAFFVRAWVRFNSTTKIADGNVSSIAYRAVGRYSLNFTSAIPNNCALLGNVSSGADAAVLTTLRIAGSFVASTGTTRIDIAIVNNGAYSDSMILCSFAAIG